MKFNSDERIWTTFRNGFAVIKLDGVEVGQVTTQEEATSMACAVEALCEYTLETLGEINPRKIREAIAALRSQ